MENDKNLEAQIDSAPPAAFKQIKDNSNNNNNANLDESGYNLFSSFPENIIINNQNFNNFANQNINNLFQLNE